MRLEVSWRTVFYVWMLSVACLLYWYDQPHSTEYIAAKTLSGVVLIECDPAPIAILLSTSGVVSSLKLSGAITAGIVTSKYGHIVTVAHGLSSCRNFGDEINITYWDEPWKTYRANILRYNDLHDVALLQVPNPPDVSPLDIADSEPAIGSKIVMVGHPESLYWAVSEGAAGFMRKWSKDRNVFQIVAPINHGNSGGPVLNNRGEVIGLLSFTLVDATFLGFAVPIDIIKAMSNGQY